jgi:class 3 adenylate cyclase/tetratricopeptide (TPR) repeat protein
MPDNAGAPESRSETAVEWLEGAKRHERQGELFLAYDLVRQGLQRFPNDLALKHRAVLCLASSGATSKAAEELVRLGLEPLPNISLATHLGLDLAALKPRLLKDAALATLGTSRTSALLKAAEAYAQVYEKAKQATNRDAYYPGVNAATLYLLGGQHDVACEFAQEVLAQLASAPAEQPNFYAIASELEAHLVLGNLDDARQCVETVRAAVQSTAQTDYRGLAAMVRQLRLIIEVKELGADWLELVAPRRVIHYLGHIISPPGVVGRFPAEKEPAVKAAIEKVLAEEDVGFGYGSLAAGADILFAEALLARGASLHLVLPFDRKEFVKVSVKPSGPAWIKRFAKCYRAAEKTGTVRYATEDGYLGDDHLFGYCSQLAMGLALLRAQHLSAAAEQIGVWDGKPASGPVGTAVDVASWRSTGLPQKEIRVHGPPSPPRTAPGTDSERGIERRIRAMLFSDINGFSKLRDEQLPRFIDQILGSTARVIERNRGDIVFANTWGDGLFLVFDDAGKAAECALDLQEALANIDLKENGLPAEMGLRVGLHLGPVFAAHDPILNRDNFFGSHVSRTARIEPVAPKGCVYATETMAAVLALHSSTQFTCQYVGMTEAAKNYPPMRMFLLGRRNATFPGLTGRGTADGSNATAVLARQLSIAVS